MTRPNLTETRTKIVATVGPACATVEMLTKMIAAGVDVFRINSAHGNREELAAKLESIRQAEQVAGFPVGVLLDLAGPKIRLGELVQEPLWCEMGATLTFIRGDSSDSPLRLTSTYPRLIDELSAGDSVMLADGTVALRVIEASKNEATCEVVSAGEIRSRQGINLPGVQLSVSAMRPDDVDNAIWGTRAGVDFISLSFVRSAEDVRSLKNLLSSYESKSLVIAKIEKQEALSDLDNIVTAADGVMVARGDLGVEIDVAETPVAQKRIIEKCREKLKPVIVATQMLDSMHHSKRPTRAEASDVANAMLDGADACMLSGETAIGEYPLETVKTMNRILRFTEESRLIRDDNSRKPFDRVHPITSAVAYAATSIAESINAKVVVVATRTGSTAWLKSKERSLIPTLGISNNDETLRRMSLFWGIKPLRVTQLDDTQQLFTEVSRWALDKNLLAKGDQMVFVTGSGLPDKSHNWLVVHTVS